MRASFSWLKKSVGRCFGGDLGHLHHLLLGHRLRFGQALGVVLDDLRVNERAHVILHAPALFLFDRHINRLLLGHGGRPYKNWPYFGMLATGSDCTDRSWSCIPLNRSEEHTSELQSLMRISYAVFCLKKKKT